MASNSTAQTLLPIPIVKTNLIAIFFHLASPVFATSHKPTLLSLGMDMNHTLKVPGLIRVAVANVKMLRARAIPPDGVLLTALKPGRTMVRVWQEPNRESAYLVTILPLRTPSDQAGNGPGVIRVALELLEIEAATSQKLGVRWPEAIQFSGSGAGQGGSATSGLNYFVSVSSARGMIQLLLQEGWAKRLANPELYVRLGEEASFHSGGEIPVSTSTEDYGRYHRHVEWKPFGLTIKVRPQSGDGWHISSDVRVEVSEVSRETAIEGIPSMVKRHVETKMDSLDGETVILSGLVRQLSGHESHKVPGLSSIPLIGNLFTSKGEQRDDSEVFMAMTLAFATRARTNQAVEGARERFENRNLR